MPSLSALDGAPVWLNSEPLTAEGLRGRVVLVDFWTYSCINWLRTLPYVTAWHEQYRDRGLVVVGVHAPEFGFEHDLDNVRRATRELDVGYPVVIDNDFAIWRSFDNHYWPAVYLVDRDGHLRFPHFGEGAYEQTERAIQQLLGVERGNRPCRGERPRRGCRLGHPEARRRPTWAPPAASAVATRAPARSRSTTGRSRASGRSATRPRSSKRPPVRSPTASRRATSIWCSRRPPRAPRSASPCSSTVSRPAMPTGSTSTSPARAPSPSRACTSWSAGEARSPQRDFEITFLDAGVRAYVFTFG